MGRSSVLEILLLQGGHKVVIGIFKNLPVHTLCALAKTDYAIRQFVLYYNRGELDVDSFLRRWFEDPIAFREAITNSDAIVAGLAPLLFLQRGQGKELDIFVEFAGVIAIGRFLQDMGY